MTLFELLTVASLPPLLPVMALLLAEALSVMAFLLAAPLLSDMLSAGALLVACIISLGRCAIRWRALGRGFTGCSATGKKKSQQQH